MKAPTPPKEISETALDSDDGLELEKSETVEIVLFDYEDEEVSFSISFEFVYTFTQSFDTEVLLS
ncbi:hypothetical protein ACFL1B_02305 [Nanoarchaeota archaeon]